MELGDLDLDAGKCRTGQTGQTNWDMGEVGRIYE